MSRVQEIKRKEKEICSLCKRNHGSISEKFDCIFDVENKELKKLEKTVNKQRAVIRALNKIAKGRVKTVNKQRAEIRALEKLLGGMVFKNVVFSDLRMMRTRLADVPRDIAPKDDRAIIFYKAQQALDRIIKRYEESGK